MNLSKSPYAGDIAPDEAWELLACEPRAQLVDVRTRAEWIFVGVPDASPLGRQVHFVEWHSFPDPRPNADFVKETAQALGDCGADADTPVLFLCRSGGRSRAAAMAMTAAGFRQAWNVSGGFEGEPDEEDHRGTRSGWKAAGLPWRQS